MESSSKNYVHLIAGGTAGTTGAVLTCPLEVVKTRLQSSVSSFVQVNVHAALRLLPSQQVTIGTTHCGHEVIVNQNYVDKLHQCSQSRLPGQAHLNSQGLISCLRHIIQTEGIRGLFKGLGPTIVGVAPSRAIYFAAYARSKKFLNGVISPDTHFVHLCSAVTAGVSASTLTNPIWFVKTRLQLDQKIESKLTCRECIRRIYAERGLRGFYKGLSASYFGVSETVVHLVLYETIKAHLQQLSVSSAHQSSNSSNNSSSNNGGGNPAVQQQSRVGDPAVAGGGAGAAAEVETKRSLLTSDYLKYMLAGACSKTFATCLCYPHEVARTRMREEGSRYNSFVQTLMLVLKEEGRAGVYRGLGTQLIRQIPNTAIVMATYEFVVHALSSSPAD